MSWRVAGGYVVAQISGGVAGALIAELMFGAELLSISSTDRLGAGLLLAEAVATAGLLIVILGCVRAHRPPTTVAFAVGAYIMAAIFFTASTAFANPAVTIARVFTDTFAGIAPAAALAFIPVQLLSASVAVLFMRWLYPPLESVSGRMVVPDAELEETGLPGTERRKSL